MGSGLPLSEAYQHVLDRVRVREQSEIHRRRLEDLRQTHRLLAMRVDEGTMTLDEAVTASVAPALTEHAEAIRTLGKRIAADVIEIGRRLVECTTLVGHGNWLPWLDREFHWSERTARNFIGAYELSLKSANIADLDLPVSTLYLLGAPSTPEAARSDVLARAEAGEAFSVAEVRRLIAETRPEKSVPDRFQELRNLVARMTRDMPDDPLVEQLWTLLQ
jgi:hypothetical protein